MVSIAVLHVPFKKEFEPVVRIGENVKLLLPNNGELYGRVTYYEQIQPQVIDLGSIGASTPTTWPQTGSPKKLEEIELGDREFGQWRMMLLDDFLIEFNIPAATGKFVVKSGKTYISRLSAIKENLLEFFTYKDVVPTLVPLNPNFFDMEVARIMVFGWRFIIEKLERPPESYTVIPITGKPTTTETR